MLDTQATFAPVKAVFENEDVEGAKLYYGTETFWADLPPGGKAEATTYIGHQWNVKIPDENGEYTRTAITWNIDHDTPSDQYFVVSQAGLQFYVTFANVDVEGAALYYTDQFWSDLGPGQVAGANTYVGHEWNVMVGGRRVAQWVIESREPGQRFELRASDLE